VEQVVSQIVFGSQRRALIDKLGEFPNGSEVRFLRSLGESTKLEVLSKSNEDSATTKLRHLEVDSPTAAMRLT
jgi:hypothetical protein